MAIDRGRPAYVLPPSTSTRGWLANPSDLIPSGICLPFPAPTVIEAGGSGLMYLLNTDVVSELQSQSWQSAPDSFTAVTGIRVRRDATRHRVCSERTGDESLWPPSDTVRIPVRTLETSGSS
jgi:hypothetical protein